MSSSKLTHYIVGAMVLGIASGYAVNTLGVHSGFAVQYIEYVSILTDIFLRLIKMIIAPLVFSTLAVGISRMGNASTIGRVGLKTFAWFLAMSTISLLLGLLMVNY